MRSPRYEPATQGQLHEMPQSDGRLQRTVQ